MSKSFGLTLNVLSLMLFIPGIFLPMFALTMELNAEVGTSELSAPMINKELSIVNTIQELWFDDSC